MHRGDREWHETAPSFISIAGGSVTVITEFLSVKVEQVINFQERGSERAPRFGAHQIWRQ